MYYSRASALGLKDPWWFSHPDLPQMQITGVSYCDGFGLTPAKTEKVFYPSIILPLAASIGNLLFSRNILV